MGLEAPEAAVLAVAPVVAPAEVVPEVVVVPAVAPVAVVPEGVVVPEAAAVPVEIDKAISHDLTRK